MNCKRRYHLLIPTKARLYVSEAGGKAGTKVDNGLNPSIKQVCRWMQSIREKRILGSVPSPATFTSVDWVGKVNSVKISQSI